MAHAKQGMGTDRQFALLYGYINTKTGKQVRQLERQKKRLERKSRRLERSSTSAINSPHLQNALTRLDQIDTELNRILGEAQQRKEKLADDMVRHILTAEIPQVEKDAKGKDKLDAERKPVQVKDAQGNPVLVKRWQKFIDQPEKLSEMARKAVRVDQRTARRMLAWSALFAFGSTGMISAAVAAGVGLTVGAATAGLGAPIAALAAGAGTALALAPVAAAMSCAALDATRKFNGANALAAAVPRSDKGVLPHVLANSGGFPAGQAVVNAPAWGFNGAIAAGTMAGSAGGIAAGAMVLNLAGVLLAPVGSFLGGYLTKTIEQKIWRDFTAGPALGIVGSSPTEAKEPTFKADQFDERMSQVCSRSTRALVSKRTGRYLGKFLLTKATWQAAKDSVKAFGTAVKRVAREPTRANVRALATNQWLQNTTALAGGAIVGGLAGAGVSFGGPGGVGVAAAPAVQNNTGGKPGWGLGSLILSTIRLLAVILPWGVTRPFHKHPKSLGEVIAAERRGREGRVATEPVVAPGPPTERSAGTEVRGPRPVAVGLVPVPAISKEIVRASGSHASGSEPASPGAVAAAYPRPRSDAGSGSDSSSGSSGRPRSPVAAERPILRPLGLPLGTGRRRTSTPRGGAQTARPASP